MFRRLFDRIFLLIARLATAGFFRSREYVGVEKIPTHKPVLLVVNHFNGFVDPVVVCGGIRRMPRFMAKSTLWKWWPMRPLYWLVGLIPVYRAVDKVDVSKNQSSFSACHKVLAKNGCIAIFPEGTTHDVPRLSQVRTGAARIAIGAKASGAQGLTIIPIGLTFTDKSRLRSKVLLRVGDPIEVPTATEDDHDAVHALTNQIRDGLQEVSPNYESVWEQRRIEFAAEVAERQPNKLRTVAMSKTEAVAQRIGKLDSNDRDQVMNAAGVYALDLQEVGIRDTELMANLTGSRFLWRLVWTTVLLAVLAPLIWVGVIVNSIPALLVYLAGQRPYAPVTKGTVKLLVGIVTFPIAWGFFAYWYADSWPEVAGNVLLYIVAGLVATWAWAEAGRLFHAWKSWRNLRNRREAVPVLMQQREKLTDLVTLLSHQ